MNFPNLAVGWNGDDFTFTWGPNLFEVKNGSITILRTFAIDAAEVAAQINDLEQGFTVTAHEIDDAIEAGEADGPIGVCHSLLDLLSLKWGEARGIFASRSDSITGDRIYTRRHGAN